MQIRLPKRWTALACLSVWAAATALAGSLLAQPPDEPRPDSSPVLRITEPHSNVEMITTSARVLELEDRIRTVYGFDPAVVDVTKVNQNPRRIRLHAQAPGVTSLTLSDENDETFEVEVLVTGDARHLQALIHRLFPHSSVKAVGLAKGVVLRGWVRRPEQINQIVALAEQFYEPANILNQMQVGGVQQVLMRVKVMEVQRSKLRELGFKFLDFDLDGFIGSNPTTGNSPITQVVPPLGNPDVEFSPLGGSALTPATMAFGFVTPENIFNGFIEALRQERLLKILAEPTLVAMNGRPANLLSGGEFPVPIAQGLGTTTIEWREFGIRLQAVPIVLSNEKVRLELQPEVSERDFSVAREINGQIVPGLRTRRTNTQVEMGFGQTLMIAGLISQQDNASTSKIPFLGELPWVGAAFRKVSYEQTETELVILITPELVGPMQPGEVPPGGPGMFTDAPTDRELFRDGMLEVPRYGNRCEGCPPGDRIPGPHAPSVHGSPGGRPPGPGVDPALPPEAAPAMPPGGNPPIDGGWKPAPGSIEDREPLPPDADADPSDGDSRNGKDAAAPVTPETGDQDESGPALESTSTSPPPRQRPIRRRTKSPTAGASGTTESPGPPPSRRLSGQSSHRENWSSLLERSQSKPPSQRRPPGLIRPKPGLIGPGEAETDRAPETSGLIAPPPRTAEPDGDE